MSKQNQHTVSPTPLSKERIFEFYLFINPLGGHCYQCEKQVLEFVEHSSYKIHVHFVAFHNFQSVTQYMRNMNLNDKDIQLRNKIYTKIYDAALSYKAALLQGKKLGRSFLIELQTQIHQEKREYTPELLHEIIQTVGLDEEMFYEDKGSELVHHEYEKDQQIAQEMFVEQNPSLVIFDNSNQQYGVLIKECITAETIAEVCSNKPLTLKACRKQLNCGTRQHQNCVVKMVH